MSEDEENEETIEEQPVGEILKQEGVIKEEEVEKREEVLDEKVDIRKVLLEVEKLKSTVETLKAIKFEADSRIKELAEEIGEIRSLFFQRDAGIVETTTKVKEIEDIVKEIKPEKIARFFAEKEKNIDEINAKLEKNNAISKDLSERIIKVEKILNQIKSIENLESIMESIGEKLERMEELKSAVERYAAKSERFYIEGERRLGEIGKMKEKVDKLNELTTELVRSFDESKIKLDACITKADFNKILEEELTSGREEKLSEMEKTVEETLDLLKSINEQYRRGIISENAYNEIKEKNRIMLENLEKQIKKIKSEQVPRNLSDWLDFVEKRIENLAAAVDSNEKKLEKLLEIRPVEKIEILPEKISPESFGIRERIDEIEDLLATVEDQYKKGIISEKAYEEVKKKNLMEIEKNKMKLARPAIERKERFEELKKRIDDLVTKLEKVEPGNTPAIPE